jgi:hypothetical protein
VQVKGGRMDASSGEVFKPQMWLIEWSQQRLFRQFFSLRDVVGKHWQNKVIWVPPYKCLMQYGLTLLRFSRTSASSGARRTLNNCKRLCIFLCACISIVVVACGSFFFLHCGRKLFYAKRRE